MKIKSHQIFYLVVLTLILLGVLTNNKEVIYSGWHTIIYKGFWSKIILAAISSLFFAILYQLLEYNNLHINSINKKMQLIIYCIGLIFYLNFIELLKAMVFQKQYILISTQNIFASRILFLSNVLISFLVLTIGIRKSHKESRTTSNNDELV